MAAMKCPNCGSFKTNTDRALLGTMGLLLVIFGGLFSFLIFPLVFAFAGLGMLVVAGCSRPKKLMCRSCGAKTIL